MKNRFLILLLLITAMASSALKAQDKKDHDYIPMLDTTNIWYMAELVEFGDYYVYNYRLGDTFIYGERMYYEILEDAPYQAISEDTLEKKIYIQGNYGSHILFYDFSLEEGDSIYSFNQHVWFYLDTVKNITIYSVIRKFYYFSYGGGNDGAIWVEGIGSLAGLLKPWTWPTLQSTWDGELLCVEQNEEFIFKSPNGEEWGCQLELFLDIETQKKEYNIILYPNPVSNTSVLEFYNPKQELFIIEIYDILGNKVFREQSKSNKFYINKNNFKQGIYTYKLINNNQIIHTNKIIIL